MSISPIGPSIIDLAGANGPSAAAAQIASRVSTASADSSVALQLELTMLEKSLQVEGRESVDLHV
jgi:hypothetical protein